MVLETVRRTIRRHQLATPASRVVIAVSGGGDSVALAHILHVLHEGQELGVVGIAHFNHQLRREADRDESFSRSLADELGYPCFVGQENVAARAKRDRQSVEHAGRTARHEFFVRAVTHFSADVVALGHTRDDQAETFLLRLLRGAGPRGLSGMHPRSGQAIRPLIDCSRAGLRAFLTERGCSFLEDATNGDVAIPRNRVRAELMPLLAGRFNPAIVEVLANQAELARDEWRWMTDEIRESGLQSEPLAGEHESWFLETSALFSSPRALRRVALWSAMMAAARGKTVSLRHVDAVLRMLESNVTSGCVDAPGHVVERIADRVVLRSGRRSRDVRGKTELFRCALPVPGQVWLPERGCILSAQFAAEYGAARELVRANMGTGATAMLASDGWTAPLSVRTRRPGDRFRPFGLAGRKKLQDFLVDRKVPRAERDRVPLVVDGNDRIVWVAGHEIDEAFRVTEASRPVLILTLRPV